MMRMLQTKVFSYNKDNNNNKESNEKMLPYCSLFVYDSVYKRKSIVQLCISYIKYKDCFFYLLVPIRNGKIKN